MSDNVIIAIVAGIPGILTAIGALVVALRSNRKADDAKGTAETALNISVTERNKRLLDER